MESPASHQRRWNDTKSRTFPPCCLTQRTPADGHGQKMCVAVERFFLPRQSPRQYVATWRRLSHGTIRLFWPRVFGNPSRQTDICRGRDLRGTTRLKHSGGNSYGLDKGGPRSLPSARSELRVSRTAD